MTAELAPQLREVLDQAAAVRAWATALAAGARREDLRARPPSGGWSALECLAHLNATLRSSRELLDDALEPALAHGPRGDAPYRTGLGARLMVRALEPPARLRTRTSAPFRPPAGLEPEAVLQERAWLLDALADQIALMPGLDLDRIRVASPFARWARYTVYEWLRVLLAHERRHLWQAERALQAAQGAAAEAAGG